jgi:hypothetical protein
MSVVFCFNQITFYYIPIQSHTYIIIPPCLSVKQPMFSFIVFQMIGKLLALYQRFFLDFINFKVNFWLPKRPVVAFNSNRLSWQCWISENVPVLGVKSRSLEFKRIYIYIYIPGTVSVDICSYLIIRNEPFRLQRLSGLPPGQSHRSRVWLPSSTGTSPGLQRAGCPRCP